MRSKAGQGSLEPSVHSRGASDKRKVSEYEEMTKMAQSVEGLSHGDESQEHKVDDLYFDEFDRGG